jgi:hypothetical protein
MSRPAVIVAFFLAIVLGAFADPAAVPSSRIFIDNEVLFNLDLFTAYISDPTIPYLPFVNESQLCYLVGAISGCSGCELGTEGLCSWIGTYLPDPVLPSIGAFYQCVPKSTSKFLQQLDYVVVWNASHNCPVDPLHEPPYTHRLWTARGPLESERASLIHNTFHDMKFADVDTHPWPVDRTALYSAAGGMELWGYNDAFFRLAGDNRAEVTCATLNDPTALDLLVGSDSTCTSNPFPHRWIDELVTGVLWNENDAFCLNAIWGAYLSTRCPKYGEAVSGIAYSLYLNLFRNCLPNNQIAHGVPVRAVHIGPSVVNLGGGIAVPFNIFGLPIVPDGTPFALHDITVPTSEQWEEYTGIDNIHLGSEYPQNAYCYFPN